MLFPLILWGQKCRYSLLEPITGTQVQRHGSVQTPGQRLGLFLILLCRILRLRSLVTGGSLAGLGAGRPYSVG